RHLVDIQYERTNSDLARGKFRVLGDTLEIQPSYEELAVRVEFFGDDVERITELDPLTGEVLADRDRIDIYPARHFVTPREKLLDYFPPDFLMFVDESHSSLPQVRGMYGGDRSRKEILVEYGFRLPSALDNRPLTFDEFEARLDQTIFVSATPGPYEHEHAAQTVEQIIRPTGLVDPQIEVRPTDGQIDDLLAEIRT